MHLNIFVVSLFAVATLLQLANCLPNRRFDTNYMNEKEKLNGNNRFLIPSNNIPFKIQVMQTKNRPAAYGPSDSPVTQQTLDTRPTSATNSSMATAPTSATSPSMATAPTSATSPSMATAPTSATSPSMATAPTSATNPTSNPYKY